MVAPIEHLTLWNTRLPLDLLSKLPSLRLLDIRGGTLESLEPISGCRALEGLVVNQIRGLHDFSALTELTSLRLLSLYGLPKVLKTPSLAALVRLARLELGSLRAFSLRVASQHDSRRLAVHEDHLDSTRRQEAYRSVLIAHRNCFDAPRIPCAAEGQRSGSGSDTPQLAASV